jgi:beta-lactamase superfamily II metal-dependent hydrolase
VEVLTLYVAQGDLAAARAGDEAVIVDAHMPDCDDVTPDQVEESLDVFVRGRRVRGLILTGLDADHACPAGVDRILTRYEPDWVLYPTAYKDTETADEVFQIIERHKKRRAGTQRPLARHSVRVDKSTERFLGGLANYFSFELFAPHIDDMDCSNNSSIVMRLTGFDAEGFSYLITGDTESEAWDRINERFDALLSSPVMSAPHHGAATGCNPETVLLVEPDTVLISAGVENAYGHPDTAAVRVYAKVARVVHATNQVAGGTCLYTRKVGDQFETHLVDHERGAAAA